MTMGMAAACSMECSPTSRAPVKCSPIIVSQCRAATQHEDRLYPENWFPFTNAVTTDPLSGQRSAILNGRPTDPLMIEVNTSTEY